MSGGARDFMSLVGLGGFVDLIVDLKFGEFLDMLLLGLDEVIVIVKVL